jgi:hypothetical protein
VGVAQASAAAASSTLEQEFHESGKLVQRAALARRRARRRSRLEQHWYLNGQPKERAEYVVAEGGSLRQETTFHDNGKKAVRRQLARRDAGSRRPRRRDRRAPAASTRPGRLRGERLPRRARAASAASASSTAAATSSATTRSSRTARARRTADDRARRLRLRDRRRRLGRLRAGGAPVGEPVRPRLPARGRAPPTRACSCTAPAGLALLAKNGAYNWGFETVPQRASAGRRGYQPRGKVLGGSSSVNAMIYVRGQPEDYDGWASEGNLGLGLGRRAAYFRRAEHNERGGDAFHGQGGPAQRPWTCAARIASGRSSSRPRSRPGTLSNADFNGARQEGVGLYQVTQQERRALQRRQGVPDAEPRAHQPARDHRRDDDEIRLDGGRATGVEARIDGVPTFVPARREVLLSPARCSRRSC